MTWTYAALKGAIAALSPPPALGDYAGAAAVLNAQTATLTGQAFTVHDAKIVAQPSGNMSWARILQRAAAPDAQVVDPSSAGYAAWQAGLGALQGVGDLTAADVAAINALATVTAPA